MMSKEEAEKRQKEISSLAGKPMMGIDNRTALGIESKEDARRTNIRIFEGASPMVKTYFEKDVERLRTTLAPGRLEPKIGFAAPADTARNMAANADLRTGNVSVANLMPTHMQANMMDSRIPDHPEKTLAEAMAKMVKFLPAVVTSERSERDYNTMKKLNAKK
jgi:hypothetical protein